LAKMDASGAHGRTKGDAMRVKATRFRRGIVRICVWAIRRTYPKDTTAIFGAVATLLTAIMMKQERIIIATTWTAVWKSRNGKIYQTTTKAGRLYPDQWRAVSHRAARQIEAQVKGAHGERV